MKKMLLILLLTKTICSTAQMYPEVYSWMRNTTGLTGYNGLPADVQSVQYTDSFVYVSSSNIPDYVIGPWPGNPNVASNQGYVFKIARYPSQNTGTLVNCPMGQIGVLKNGVVFFNPRDINSYNGQGIWHQNAVVVEGPSFDACLGHPAPGGVYHNHQRPFCLYTADSTMHSPLLGYAFDGFPVYGAYAYANANGTGGITRMKSSYRMRNITDRTTLPDGTILTSGQYGPAISGSYPIGYYTEDFEFVMGLGDLDAHNGRFCVTPEYPAGIYCYFATIDSLGNSAYPYMIGPNYYGNLIAGNTGMGGHNTIPSSATVYTGIPEVKNADVISVYPNPAKDEFNVSGLKFNVGSLEIYNSIGKNIFIKQINFSEEKIDCGNFSSGIYLLKINSGSTSLTKKFIIER